MTLTLKLIHETDTAILYECENGNQVWIPKHVIKSTMKLPDNVHTVEVEEWWAQDRGWVKV